MRINSWCRDYLDFIGRKALNLCGGWFSLSRTGVQWLFPMASPLYVMLTLYLPKRCVVRYCRGEETRK